MGRFAVFVDAGYLYESVISLLFPKVRGSNSGRQGRDSVIIDPVELCTWFIDFGTQITNRRELLRFYWYDAARAKSDLDGSQRKFAHCDDVKLRLGRLAGEGATQRQKGVDSLIVLDITNLARNKAIDDVVLVSGDEDILPAVSEAQTYGVRVHLVGVHPIVRQRLADGNQSPLLIAECDTSKELLIADIQKFADYSDVERSVSAIPSTPASDLKPPEPSVFKPTEQEVDCDEVGKLAANSLFDDDPEFFDQDTLKRWRKGDKYVGGEIDRVLFEFARGITNIAVFTQSEMENIRESFIDQVLQRSD